MVVLSEKSCERRVGAVRGSMAAAATVAAGERLTWRPGRPRGPRNESGGGQKKPGANIWARCLILRGTPPPGQPALRPAAPILHWAGGVADRCYTAQFRSRRCLRPVAWPGKPNLTAARRTRALTTRKTQSAPACECAVTWVASEPRANSPPTKPACRGLRRLCVRGGGRRYGTVRTAAAPSASQPRMKLMPPQGTKRRRPAKPVKVCR